MSPPRWPKAGCSRFYVAWPQEGAALRRDLGPAPEILVFHGADAGHARSLPDVRSSQPVLNHLEQIDLWLTANVQPRPAALHVDTGMNRLGVSRGHWAAAARMLPEADAPRSATSPAATRPARTTPPSSNASSAPAPSGPASPPASPPPAAPISARTIISTKSAPASPSMAAAPRPPKAQPPHTVVTLTAPILQVRDANKGETVGYGCTWTAEADCQLATIGLGYADGYLRSASNQGKVVRAGPEAPHRRPRLDGPDHRRCHRTFRVAGG